MKVFLMYRKQNLDLQQNLPLHEHIIIKDLELNILFNVMAQDDKFLYDVAKKVILCSLTDLDTIKYRQDILKDCLKNPEIIRDIYNIAIESIENKKKFYLGIFTKYPSSILHSSIEILEMYTLLIKKLRDIGDASADKFESEGFKLFFEIIKREFSDDYLLLIQNHLNNLKFRRGVLLSAELGNGNVGVNYILCKPQENKQNWIQQLFAKKEPIYSFYISERDESGTRALAEIKDRGINIAANALAQAADHIQNFFVMLRNELAFYIGCINLHEELIKIGEHVSFPGPVLPANERRHFCKDLYDICLALTKKDRVVSNDVNADNKGIVVITGANQGGKSTFLRSIGLAQLMMQCGMFVAASYFSANVCNGLFTHFKRAEDNTMKSGKLDEELTRMSSIIDHITPHSLILFNESFAATNEREGSEIARQIIWALVEKNIKIFFVTHLYDFAQALYNRKMENAIFLRAERQSDGGRTFKLAEGKPLQTSYGEDLYNNIFGPKVKMAEPQ